MGFEEFSLRWENEPTVAPPFNEKTIHSFLDRGHRESIRPWHPHAADVTCTMVIGVKAAGLRSARRWLGWFASEARLLSMKNGVLVMVFVSMERWLVT